MSRLEVRRNVVPCDRGMAPGATDDRRADENAVVVVGIILRFDQPLLTAGRAAGVIGMLRRFTIESLGDVLAHDGHHMGRKTSPVLPFLRMADEGIAVERRRRRRSHVGHRGGVAALDRSLHARIAKVEYAAVAAVAVAVEHPGPALFRQPHLDADVGVGRVLHGSDHAAERGHSFSDGFVGGRVIAGRNGLRGLDRRVRQFEARQILARTRQGRARARQRGQGDRGRRDTSKPRHTPAHLEHRFLLRVAQRQRSYGGAVAPGPLKSPPDGLRCGLLCL